MSAFREKGVHLGVRARQDRPAGCGRAGEVDGGSCSCEVMVICAVRDDQQEEKPSWTSDEETD